MHQVYLNKSKKSCIYMNYKTLSKTFKTLKENFTIYECKRYLSKVNIGRDGSPRNLDVALVCKCIPGGRGGQL